MLDYNKIDVSEGIETNKTNGFWDRNCHYWYFLMISRFQSKLWDGCHDIGTKIDDIG